MQHKNKTVVRSMDILNLFITRPALSINDMVELSKIPKTSVHRMVKTLEEMGFLQKDAQGRYSLGLLFLQFGQLVADRLDIRHLALPFMNQLRDEVGEAVNLIVKDGPDAIYIEKVDTQHPVRMYTKIGRRAPLYAGACARVILAFLPDEEREQYLGEIELKPIGKGTIVEHRTLCDVVEQSRHLGYTISYSELENETAAVAAPIFDYTGQLCAGLSIAGPESRFQPDRLPHLIEKVKETAANISRQLGWTGHY
ncbi:MAG TPA: IclR family transcriptional regulator [Candidatus Bathyarchaeia archaeon]|nr:IclR family transcriptional regulator [Candidatus Bathyarchaeia archaeon]